MPERTLFPHFSVAETAVAESLAIEGELLLGESLAVKLISIDVFQYTFDFIVCGVQWDFDKTIVQVEKVWTCQCLLRS